MVAEEIETHTGTERLSNIDYREDDNRLYGEVLPHVKCTMSNPDPLARMCPRDKIPFSPL